MLANSADPDEPASNEPSHHDLHCLLTIFDFLKITISEEWDNLKMWIARWTEQRETLVSNSPLGYLVSKELKHIATKMTKCPIYIIVMHHDKIGGFGYVISVDTDPPAISPVFNCVTIM